MYWHLHFLQPESYFPDTAALALYPNVVDSVTRRKRAIQLKQILDGKGIYVRFNFIPNDTNFIDSLTQMALYTPYPDQLPEVYLERLNNRWYYSQETVTAIPKLHRSVYPYGLDRLLNISPKFGQTKFLGYSLWQYFSFLVIILLSFFVHAILSRILGPIVGRLSRSRLYPSLIEPDLVQRIARLISVLLIFKGIRMLLPVLLLPPATTAFTITFIKIVNTILVMLIVLRILEVLMLYFRKLTERTENKLDEQLVPIISRSAQILIVIGAMAQILSIFEVNLTALIAGLSIGGLALALAAQDTVKNLIGSAMIFVDQPFQIGDYIDGGSFAGTVVEVGFRTTRIIKPDSSIISVPNGTIANQVITNLGVRVYRLFQTELGITYDTPPDLIEQFVAGLHQLVEAHPEANDEGAYIYVSSFGASSINILFRVPIAVKDYGSELAVKETLILEIIRLAEALGVRFAFPSTTMYVEEFPGKPSLMPTYTTDAEKVKVAIAGFMENYKKKLEEKAKKKEEQQ
ncbi:MAG: hypothetical protein DHS20C18_26890 [Saprospiraceae bacterium]|nr:MAG: hypothetical protein DHS20C18_26890 [Saprospiraceae bacterium]